MLTSTRVLIRQGRGYSAVGTATVERDPATGRQRLHVRLVAPAPLLYVPLPDDPACAPQPDLDDDLRGAAAEHA